MMTCRTSVWIAVWLAAGSCSSLYADDREQAAPPAESGTSALVPTPDTLHQRPPETDRALLGRGYVPYSYPALNSCPCSRNDCFDPARYCFGGKPYRRSWMRRWLRAHLGRGSMLDGYACECLFPSACRLRVPAGTARVAPMADVPPRPEPSPPGPTDY